MRGNIYFKYYSWVVAITMMILSGILMTCKRTHTPIYDNKNDKLWAHYINSPSKANERFNKFQGVELDINFDDSLHTFLVEYTLDEKTNLTLESYFDSIKNVSQHYYWLDLKNLSGGNARRAARTMKKILDRYQITNRAIIESNQLGHLKAFTKKGLYTSYWVPHFEYSNPPDTLALVKYLRKTWEENSINAFSANFTMEPFLSRYFSDCTIHLWTNGMDTSYYDLLHSYGNKPCIKVILFDYDINILQHRH